MPVLKFYRHGLTAGTPPGNNSHERGKREKLAGWSRSSIRSNTRFLYSVDERVLDGVGCAVTLTVKRCPPSSDEWHKIRRRFEKRLVRMNLIREHWLTEWQRRCVPHLHAALYFPDVPDAERGRFYGRIVDHWMECAAEYEPELSGQNLTLIYEPIGWLKYVSKHAARGLMHYQRSSDSMPPAWLGKTGRMWGKVGEWPLGSTLEVDLDTQGYWRFRRIVRSWRTADARAAKSKRRILSARRMLRCFDKRLSAVRGVSEWIDQERGLQILTHLASQGYRVEQ